MNLLPKPASKAKIPVNLYKNVIPYGAATGAVNVYRLDLNPPLASLEAGQGVAVKINIDQTLAATLNINGLGAKGIKRADGTDYLNLLADGIYSLRYDGTNFILQGEGGNGDAVAADLLAGKTAGTSLGDITGTMPNKTGAALVFTPGTVDQAITKGYYPGGVGDGMVLGDADLIAANIISGKNIFGVAGSLPNKAGAALVFTPGSVDQAITQGYYPGGVGDGKVLGDADLVAANIKAGVSIFGVTGAFVGSGKPLVLCQTDVVGMTASAGFTWVSNGASVPPGMTLDKPAAGEEVLYSPMMDLTNYSTLHILVKADTGFSVWCGLADSQIYETAVNFDLAQTIAAGNYVKYAMNVSALNGSYCFKICSNDSTGGLTLYHAVLVA